MRKADFSDLNAVFVNCTLKKSPQKSHTSTLISVSKSIMDKEGVRTEEIRLVDHQVATGIYPDMTEHNWDKDEWPALFKKIINADILIVGTPIWLGEKSSVAQKLIERLYAMSGKINDKGQYIFYGKVGGCIITATKMASNIALWEYCTLCNMLDIQYLRRQIAVGLVKLDLVRAMGILNGKAKKYILRWVLIVISPIKTPLL